MLHAPRAESRSALSPAHHQQLSHWPSLQSFLLLHFTAIFCLAPRKIPHSVGVENTTTASGCVATKNKGKLWCSQCLQAQGQCLRTLPRGVPTPWARSQRCLHSCPQPHQFVNPNIVRCMVSATSPHGDLPGPPGNCLSYPMSSCLSALWRGEKCTLPLLVFPTGHPAQNVCLEALTEAYLLKVLTEVTSLAMLLWSA